MGIDLNLSPPCVDDGFVKTETSPSGDEDGAKSGEEAEDCVDGVSDICSALERSLEPGNLIEDIDQAYVLYCEYARCKGFSVRKGCQKYFDNSSEMRMKVFNCSCEGLPDNRRSNTGLGVYKKQVTRANCKARLRLLRQRGGPWTVSVFEKDHTHELVSADQSYLLRSARQLRGAKRSILEALHTAGIPVTRACKFLERESGGRMNVGFTRTDAYIHLRRKKVERSIENGDAKALIQFFQDKSNKEPFFYWKVDHDIDGNLVSFFFRDSRCAVDYEHFGDVVSFDTTYKTNKYNMICAPFIGVNHHFQNVMFGLAFLSDEKTETFEWLFRVFLDAMYGKEPEVIFTDQCLALMNGVDYTFESASHRLCQWHINQNAASRFGKLNANPEFKRMWSHCMNGCETEDEFEEVWQQLIENNDLANNTWFTNMYNLRSRWSSVFTNDRFSAGMHATSRSEVTNRILKDLGKRSNTLFEFVIRYCEVQKEWRDRENAEDALCRGMPGQFVKHNPLLKNIAEVFTRNIYKIFEYEAHHAMNIKVIEHPDYASENMSFRVNSGPDNHRIRVVSFNKTSHDVSCTCRMWESKGIFCRHIFKVLYWMNVDDMPEKYILRRWKRDCKLRCGTGRTNPSPNVDENLSGLVFVNSIMRLSYDMAYEAKSDAGCRSRVHKCLWKLRQQMLKERELRSKMPHKKDMTASELLKVIKNPQVVKTRPRTVRRKWKNSKLKAGKAVPDAKGANQSSPVSSRIDEAEKSFKEPDRYWPEFCDDYNSQQSQSFHDKRLRYGDKVSERGGNDESMPYTWL